MARAYNYQKTKELTVIAAIKANFSNLKIRVPNQSFAFDSACEEYSLDQICSKWPDPLFHAVKVSTEYILHKSLPTLVTKYL